MTEGQAILIPPGAVHLCCPEDPERFNFTMIHISPAWFTRSFSMNPSDFLPGIAGIRRDLDRQRRHFTKRFASVADSMTLESEALCFIGAILHRCFQYRPQAPPGRTGSQAVQKAKDHLDRHFTEPILLADLAEVSGLGPYTLLRRFKAAHGLPPHAFLVNKRINKARKDLARGLSVARVATDCGFFDQSHFIKTFRQYVGLTPSQYKKGFR